MRLLSCNTRVYPEFRRDESRSHISTNETLEGAMVQTTSYFTFASFSISVVPRFASAIVRAESVVAEGIFMAHGRGCRTFIDIYYKKGKKKVIMICRGAFKEKSAGTGPTNCMLVTTKTRAEVRHAKTIYGSSFQEDGQAPVQCAVLSMKHFIYHFTYTSYMALRMTWPHQVVTPRK